MSIFSALKYSIAYRAVSVGGALALSIGTSVVRGEFGGFAFTCFIFDIIFSIILAFVSFSAGFKVFVSYIFLTGIWLSIFWLIISA